MNLPVAGRLGSRHRGVEVVARRQRAAVYRPDDEVTLTPWAAACRQLCVSSCRTPTATRTDIDSIKGVTTRRLPIIRR